MDKALLFLERLCEHGHVSPHTWDHTVRPPIPLDETCTEGSRTILDRTRLVEAVANAIASHDMQSGPFNMLAEIGQDMADAYRAYAAKHIDALLSEVDD